MNLGALPADGPIVEGREIGRGFEETCDVVIVGSGAGGAVIAAILAEAGQRVIVLEEGPYYTQAEYAAFRPTESMRRLWRESGLLTALGLGQTPVIGLSAGRCVGGSSVLTGGVCFRIPSEIHAHWVDELGLSELSEKSLEPAYEAVERRDPRRRSSGIDALRSNVEVRARSGATRHSDVSHQAQHRGVRRKCALQLRLPERGQAIGRCVVPSLLRSRAAARVVSDALVERVNIDRGRAVGVSGHLLDGPGGCAVEPVSRARARRRRRLRHAAHAAPPLAQRSRSRPPPLSAAT